MEVAFLRLRHLRCGLNIWRGKGRIHVAGQRGVAAGVGATRGGELLAPTLVIMGIQDDASRNFVAALSQRNIGSVAAMGMTPSVTLTTHPEATVYFDVDQFGGLLMKLSFDGGPARPISLTPANASYDGLVNYVLEKVAGEGGGPLSQA